MASEIEMGKTAGIVAYSDASVEGTITPVNPDYKVEVPETSNHIHEENHDGSTPQHKEEKDASVPYCSLVVKHYKTAFGVTLAAHIFMIVVSAILVASGYDLLPIDFEGVPLNLQSDSTKLRTDAWLYVKDSENVANLNGQQIERSVEYQGISMIYAKEGGNVFTKENLLAIQESEEALINNTDYEKKLCQTVLVENTNKTVCKPPLSILRFFDGSYKALDPVLDDPNFEDIAAVLYAADSMNFTRAILNYHLGKDSVINEDKATSQYTRTLIYIGWPLEGYMNTDDKDEDQMDELNKRIVDQFATKLENKNKDGIAATSFYYNNLALSNDAIQKQVVLDMMLAVASLVFIFVFMWFQTGSLWLTAWGIFSVLSSFNISNLIYRIVFDYRYFGIFHVLSIFIILGIGSDNVFVFMDTWKQSANESFKNLNLRLSTVYRHAAKATLITSFTTMIAFISNVQSPLLAISSFGLFSAILVIVNYLSVILFYPTVIIVHNNSRRGRCCCGPMCGKVASDSPDGTKSRKSVLEYVIYFFDGPFFIYVISHKIVRWIVILFFLALLGIMIGFAAQIEPDTDQIQPWKSDTNWARAQDLAKSAFRPSPEDEVVIVHIIWGLNEQDRSECHRTDYKCKGKTVFDRSFDPNPPPCQIAMLDLCKELKNLPPEQEDELKLRRSQVTGEVEVECVFERMDEYMTVEGNNSKYPVGTNFSFPINNDKINVLRKYNNETFTKDLPDIYYRFFEIGLAYFITDGNKRTFASSYDFKKYVDYIGGEGDSNKDSSNINSIQGDNYGHRLLYAAIAVNLTLKPSSLGYENGLPIYDNWENYISNKMDNLPKSFTACNNAFQTTATYYNVWHWLKVQEILVNNAILGIVIGLVLALIVLTLATANIIIGFLATLTIAMVTASVLGMIPILGWKLGLFESLNLTLIVGLAVDYVVHLAEGYMILSDKDRLTRVRYTLGHVGVSVFSGACTTIGASIFMLAAKIVFFAQFGIFIFCTIGFSILYSMFFFTTVMGLIGPEGETGSLRPIARKIKDFIRGKTKEDEDCVTCEGKGFYKRLPHDVGVTNTAY